MSIRSAVRSSFVAAAVLSTSAFAFARQPPALVNAQRQADEAFCAGARAVGGAGYRNGAVRLARETAEPRSAGGRATGYRDAYSRFGRSAPQVAACTTPSHLVALSASR